MRIIIQRVLEARVRVAGETVAEIGNGMALLVGLGEGDTPEDLELMARTVRDLRIFADERGKMNLDVRQTGGAILSIPNFTLYGDVSRGRRPSFSSAAKPETAARSFEQFGEILRQSGLRVETGVFGAHMRVELVNDGPVTLSLDSAGFRPRTVTRL